MEIPVTAVILAAGLGTRMKSKRAKVLHEAGGQTLIEYIVDTAVSITAPERVFVVVGHQAEEVRAVVRDRGVRFVLQPEPKGTGHAVMACREAAEAAGGLLLVLYGDCPLLSAGTLGALVERQRVRDAAGTVLTAVLEDPAGYGRILRGDGDDIESIVEQKAATPEQLAVKEINSGIYCFDSALLWKHIAEIRPDNPAGEYYLTDIVGIFRRAGHKTRALLHADARELLGINSRVELAEADRILRGRVTRRLMIEGVTIEKPETVTIDARVRAGADTVIEPFAQIRGRSVIGENCRIGAGAVIRDSTLADEVTVAPYSIILDSHVGRGAHVGPFSRVRTGSRVEAGARVGNFVELKNTRLGAGAKSLHLAYLGDSVVGEEANIGAGSITCNYDGVRKHQTRIGKRAFVGSNATLVAPLEIGDGSYIGAGSVITDLVPPDALAVGRVRQVNKEGWARKRPKKP